MTNLQIILTNIETHNIKEEVDTYAGWQRRNKQVKRGSKALFKTKIWKPVARKKSDLENPDKMILVNASFFGISQVE